MPSLPPTSALLASAGRGRSVDLLGPIGTRPLRTILDTIAAPRQSDLGVVIDHGRRGVDVARALAELDPRSREILRFHFGLDGGVPWTLRKLGERHGVSRERIRQIEKQALHRLRELIEGRVPSLRQQG